jgi:hypothetical protein
MNQPKPEERDPHNKLTWLFTLAQILLCLKPNGVATKPPPITAMTVLSTCLPAGRRNYILKISFVLQSHL